MKRIEFDIKSQEQIEEWLEEVEGRMSENDLNYIATIAFLLILYGVIEYTGGSGAMAAFAFGLVLGNSKKVFSALQKERKNLMTHSRRFFYSEISFFLKSFFFVYLGLLINFADYKWDITNKLNKTNV